jgi:hypothetical protein
MQLGLLAKLIGRSAEIKALPVTVTYAPATLRWEAGKGIAGAAVGVGILLGLDPAAWIAVPLALVCVLLGLYALQQARRFGVRYEVTPKAATRIQGQRRETIAWRELDGFRLHFYGFGKQERTGTLEVLLTGGGRRIKADSALDHFPTLLAHAAQAARTRGLTLDPTTQSNLEHLGL